jgi:peptidoglycan/LPS O-acetylase OafA/YrhL
LRYRPEIDGLRAIALISVVLFHAGFGIFSGGFIGVDIFFVISGYLITFIILSEKEAGKFTLKSFYERRARRILPALIFITILCIPTAYFLLLPKDFRNFSQSLVSVSFFSSNILFWQESNYFDIASELKPLLHTWSLSIEEQFYIVFSLLILSTSPIILLK